MKVGLILPMTANEGGIGRYRELRDPACHAGRAGLDSVWVCDHIPGRWYIDAFAGAEHDG